MQLNRLFASGVAAVAGGSILLASGFTFIQQAYAEEIKIGVSLPLTGDGASYGEDTRKAITFALKLSGRTDLKLVFEDDKCTGKGAVAAAQKLISIDHVKAVLGPLCSGAVLAAAPVYEKEKIPAIAIAASAPAISNAGRYIFRLSTSDTASSRMLAEHVKSSGTKSVGVLSEQTEYCEGFRAGFSKFLKDSGLAVSEEIFNPGDTDFRSLLLKLKGDGVEVLFINTQSDRTFSVAVKQLAQIHWKPRLYAAYWPSSAGVLKSLGKLAEGIEFVDFPAPEDFLAPEGRKLYAEYVREFGLPESNPIIVPLALQALELVAQLEGQPDQMAFLEKSQHEGLWGKYQFDENGDLMDAPLVISRIRDGKVEKL